MVRGMRLEQTHRPRAASVKYFPLNYLFVQRGDDEPPVTQAPEDGDGGSGGDWPEWDSGHPEQVRGVSCHTVIS